MVAYNAAFNAKESPRIGPAIGPQRPKSLEQKRQEKEETLRASTKKIFEHVLFKNRFQISIGQFKTFMEDLRTKINQSKFERTLRDRQERNADNETEKWDWGRWSRECNQLNERDAEWLFIHAHKLYVVDLFSDPDAEADEIQEAQTEISLDKLKVKLSYLEKFTADIRSTTLIHKLEKDIESLSFDENVLKSEFAQFKS
eukprot:UN27651